MIKIYIFLLVLFPFWGNVYAEYVHTSGNNRLKMIKGIHEDNFIRIPPPANFALKSKSLKQSNIEIKYNNFPIEAKNALEYAVGIWESLIYSEITINITANWEELEEDDENTTLGAAAPTEHRINNSSFPQSNVFYNIPLAEKLSRSQLNKAQISDIYMVFNSEANWYFGTDGNTPGGQFDFVSVALHEIAHGLGFQGSMFINEEGEGEWGYGSKYPFSFDQYVYNGANQKIIDHNLFPNPSFMLKEQMVSDDLYFDGPVLKNNYGSKAKLYVPNQYNEGSSISHISRDFDNTPEDMMTPGIQTGASIHNPGLITMGILEDIGWTTIHIEHEMLKSREALTDIEITAKILPDFETEVTSLLHYAINGNSIQTIPMKANIVDSTYSAIIEISENVELEYFISVKDKYSRSFIYPNTAPDTPFYLNVGVDTISPEIVHLPHNKLYDPNELLLLANVTDLYGIDSVYVEYLINGKPKSDILLKLTKGDTYNVSINLSMFNLKEGDLVEYRLVAVDASESKNKAYYPKNGFYELEVFNVPEYLETYKTDFETGANEFHLDGFDYSKPSGFSSVALNSEHPYETGGEDTWLDFTAELIFPIKIHEVYHYIAFDEIALIEPGEGNVAFPDPDFFDYVVVEGSKDNGLNWFPFEDGWDCRLHEEWIETYYQSYNFYNFDLIPDLGLFKHHQVDLTYSDEFAAGDVVLIRFRLNSDPYEAGWGWMIDNLEIQTIGLDVKQKRLPGFEIYPNPVTNGEISIKGLNVEIKNVKLFDLNGKLMFVQSINEFDKVFFSKNIKGLYILHIETESSVYKSKLLFN